MRSAVALATRRKGNKPLSESATYVPETSLKTSTLAEITRFSRASSQRPRRDPRHAHNMTPAAIATKLLRF